MLIRPEQACDCDAIRKVHQAAFQGDVEARLVDALRAGGFSPVSLVAVEGNEIVGHVLFSDLTIVLPDRAKPALSLAPVGVSPAWQRRGVGSALIDAGLKLCREQGHSIVIVLGEPEYYRRFGFSVELASPLQSEYAGDYFMALELVPEALRGIAGRVEYSPPFAALG